jgi:predicted TIM-barrel fold metal-dependent hydrolase
MLITDLFLNLTDRITIGSDTWTNAQWDNYEAIITFDRNWLAQLPDEVARQIAFENAKRLFDQ